MTREEAIQILSDLQDGSGQTYEAIRMAIEALTVAVSREDTVTLNSPISIQAEMVAVVRCKDCRHHGMRDCPVWGDDTTEDYMWCYYGERKE